MSSILCTCCNLREGGKRLAEMGKKKRRGRIKFFKNFLHRVIEVKYGNKINLIGSKIFVTTMVIHKKVLNKSRCIMYTLNIYFHIFLQRLLFSVGYPYLL